MRNLIIPILSLFAFTVIGFILGFVMALSVVDKDFSRYTLNCVEQNMTLKEMAFERFPNDYKLRFNDWNSTSTPNQPKEKE
jgi:hypothetical protein